MTFVMSAHSAISYYAIPHCGIPYNEIAVRPARNSLFLAPAGGLACADGSAAALRGSTTCRCATCAGSVSGRWAGPEDHRRIASVSRATSFQHTFIFFNRAAPGVVRR